MKQAGVQLRHLISAGQSGVLAASGAGAQFCHQLGTGRAGHLVAVPRHSVGRIFTTPPAESSAAAGRAIRPEVDTRRPPHCPYRSGRHLTRRHRRRPLGGSRVEGGDGELAPFGLIPAMFVIHGGSVAIAEGTDQGGL